jgi:hypothetical protein
MLSAGLLMNGGNGRNQGGKVGGGRTDEVFIRKIDFVSALCPSPSRLRTTVRAVFRRRVHAANWLTGARLADKTKDECICMFWKRQTYQYLV